MSLEIFCQINGIGAASGIVHVDNSLYLVSDASTFLYRYDIAENQLHKIQFNETGDENMRKKHKPDFEILTRLGNDLYLMGSGSTAKRNLQVIYNLHTKNIQTLDASDLYEKFKTAAAFNDDQLNLEGACFHKEKWYYFQRGNGGTGTNGVFIVDGNNIQFHAIALPKIKHVEATFTDAIVVDDTAYFLAAAEDSNSTYLDGEVLGSLIGRLDLESMQVDFTEQISNQQKLEGLTLFERNKDQLVFLLCEDNDTEVIESTIYRFTMPL